MSSLKELSNRLSATQQVSIPHNFFNNDDSSSQTMSSLKELSNRLSASQQINKTPSVLSAIKQDIKKPSVLSAIRQDIKTPKILSASQQAIKTPSVLSAIQQDIKTPKIIKNGSMFNSLTPVMSNNMNLRDIFNFNNNKLSMKPIFTNLPLSSFTNNKEHDDMSIGVLPIPYVYTTKYTDMERLNDINILSNEDKIQEINVENDIEIIDEEGNINDENLIEQSIQETSSPKSNIQQFSSMNKPSAHVSIPHNFFNNDSSINENEESVIYNYTDHIQKDPANKLTHLTFIERMNVDDVERVKEFVDENQTTNIFNYPQSTSAFIDNLLKKVDNDEIINYVTYTTFHPTMSGIEIPGRIKCSKNSVFVLQRLIRNSLINNNYIDIDMVNAHLGFLSNILKIYLPNYKNDSNFKYIDVLISKRNDLIERMKWLFMHTDGSDLLKLECKNFIFGNMYSYQRFDYIPENSKFKNNKVEKLINYTKVGNMKEIRTFTYFFIKWFIKNDNDIQFNVKNINDPIYNKRMRNFINLCNNISNSIRNIQIFITLLHENGVPMTEENKDYSIAKVFTDESHSYINSMRNKSIIYREDAKYYDISDNAFVDSDIRVVPNVIPPSTTQNIYFYLYNTSLRQQLRYKCFEQDYTADNKIFYNTDSLEECYKCFNVVFRLIMNEYEKTMLWHCINYTMKKLGIDNNLHAVLCHDGFMLDREYFEGPNAPLRYDTYLCDLKNYIEEETGFNINIEYKDHCDEMISTITCEHAAENYSCDDQHNYSKKWDENKSYSPRTKNEIMNLTTIWNLNNPDSVTEIVNDKEITRDIYKLYYDSNNDKYYHFSNNKPVKSEDPNNYNSKKENTRIDVDEDENIDESTYEAEKMNDELYPMHNDVDEFKVFDNNFSFEKYFE
jgi:hypothetical protein